MVNDELFGARSVMRIYLTFLVLAVVIGGSSLGPRLSRRPVLILAACAALGAVFFTYRSV